MRLRSKRVIYTYNTILYFALLLHIIIEIFKVSLHFTLQNCDIIKNYDAYTRGYNMLDVFRWTCVVVVLYKE
jgi:uncharacterized protein YebE (UPF0316 family)